MRTRMRNFDILFWTYNVIWLGIGRYLTFLAQRSKTVGERLERLEKNDYKSVGS